MYPEIHIGPLTLQTFGLMFALAFLAAGALIWKRWGRSASRPTGPMRWASRRSSAASSAPASTSSSRTTTGQGRPARQPLLRLGPGLVRRRDRRRPRRPALGLVPRLPRPRPARPGGAGAGARLRDRPLRLPALRRRRLRQGLERALGDVLPRRHRADRPNRPPDADLRDAGDGPRRLAPLAAARPLPRRRPLRDLPASTREPSASWSSSCAATTTVALGLTAAQLESLAMMVAGAIWIAIVDPPPRRHRRPRRTKRSEQL